jgi:hypothetical protein
VSIQDISQPSAKGALPQFSRKAIIPQSLISSHHKRQVPDRPPAWYREESQPDRKPVVTTHHIHNAHAHQSHRLRSKPVGRSIRPSLPPSVVSRSGSKPIDESPALHTHHHENPTHHSPAPKIPTKDSKRGPVDHALPCLATIPYPHSPSLQATHHLSFSLQFCVCPSCRNTNDYPIGKEFLWLCLCWAIMGQIAAVVMLIKKM